MRKFLKRIRGTEEPGDFYIRNGGLVFLLLLGVAGIIFGRGEYKWGGVFAIGVALDFLIVLPLLNRPASLK